MKINGGQLVARTLVDMGVRDIFGVHGGHLDAFLAGMADLGVNIIDLRHEAAAGNAAEGYARVTGGLGVVFATAGPGFANVYSALAKARIDRIPIMLITSSSPQREAELNVLQGGLDQVAAANTVAKFAHRATTVARLPVLIIVFNNLGWGMSFHGQDMVFGPGARVASDLPDTRYDQIAESVGCYGERVTRLEEIAPAIRRARSDGRPACIDLTIDPNVVHPMMDPLAAELPAGATRIPYYEPVPAGEV